MSNDDEITIDDVLLREDEPEEAVVVKTESHPVFKTEQTYDFTRACPGIVELRDKFREYDRNCRDVLLDMRTVKFRASDTDMCLIPPLEAYPRPIYFKGDVQDNKNKKVTHAQKQFCRMIGVPHSFFAVNRPQLKEHMIATWQTSINAINDKSEVLVRIREGTDSSLIRALFPESSSMARIQDLLTAIIETVKCPLTLEFAHGEGMDDLVFHARFLLHSEYKVLDRVLIPGFSMVSSELGACPFILETLMSDKESNTAYLASYAGKPFFKTKGDGIQPQAIKDILGRLTERIEGEAQVMVERIQDVLKAESVSIEESCTQIGRMSGLDSKQKRALYHQATESRSTIQNALDFARCICDIAKGSETLKRLAFERACGRYLNLSFPKI